MSDDQTTYCLGCERKLAQRPKGRKRLFHAPLCEYRWRGRAARRTSRARTVCKCGQVFRQKPGRGKPRTLCRYCRK